MAKAPRPWIVTPHKPIQKLEDNLWLVQNRVPGTRMMRRMAIVKRSDGTLLFYQAIPLDEPSMAAVKAWGKPAYLVVPHNQHGVDAPAFAEKLGVGIYGPKQDEEKMRAKFKLAGTVEDIPPDPAVTFEPAAGVKHGEPIAIVRSAGGRVSLHFADAYMANPSEGMPLLMRIAGFGGGPRVVPLFRIAYLRDKGALRAQFERLAATPGLAHLVPCHGLIESTDPAGTLQRVAATL